MRYTDAMLGELIDNEVLVCPVCRRRQNGVLHQHSLIIDSVNKRTHGLPMEGFLKCCGCPARFPIIDGVAIIMADVAGWLKQQERPVFHRQDLSSEMSNWLSLAWNDEEDPSWRRQMLAVYGRKLLPLAHDMWQDTLEPILRQSQDFHSKRQRLLIEDGQSPLILDAGCNVGVHTLAMAAMGGRIIAIDNDFGALSVLSRLLYSGHVTVPIWRHGGSDYTHVEINRPKGVQPEQCALIAADMLDPPLRGQTLDAVTCYNIIDNVANPVLLLRQAHAGLKLNGKLIISTPYEWVSRCTPLQHRLGEAIRIGDDPDPSQALHDLVTGKMPQHAPEFNMVITHEDRCLPWVVVRHNRSAHIYNTHYVEAIRQDQNATVEGI